MQLRIVSKEEAHKLIDEAPGNSVLVLTYDEVIGLSDYGKYIKKRKGKKLIDKSQILVLSENNPVTTLNLHRLDLKNISKSIIIPKLEWDLRTGVHKEYWQNQTKVLYLLLLLVQKDLSTHTNGVHSTSEMDRPSYIHTNSYADIWLEFERAETLTCIITYLIV